MKANLVPVLIAALLWTSHDAAAQSGPDSLPKPTEASKRLSELNKASAARGTETAETLAQRVQDLEAFLREHPESREATGVRFAICQLAVKDSRQTDAARRALEAFDAKASEEGAALLAVKFANQLGFREVGARIKEQVAQRTMSLQDRLELHGNMKVIAKDEDWAADFRASIEQSATSKEDRAEIALYDAAFLIRTDRKNRDAYDAALKRVATEFEDTPAGKLAHSKLAAHNLTVGSDPIDFSATDLSGQPVSLADYRGKVLLVDFWASWCVPCMKEMPHVVAAHERFHDRGFEVLGISLDRAGQQDKLVRVLETNKMPWRQVFDGGHWRAKVAQQYDVQSIPFTVLIGKDGKVAGLNLRGDQLAQAVERELAKQ